MSVAMIRVEKSGWLRIAIGCRAVSFYSRAEIDDESKGVEAYGGSLLSSEVVSG